MARFITSGKVILNIDHIIWVEQLTYVPNSQKEIGSPGGLRVFMVRGEVHISPEHEANFLADLGRLSEHVADYEEDDVDG